MPYVIKNYPPQAYVAGIFRNLREHGYDPRLMRLTVVGGVGRLIKNFADCDKSRITVIDDICATAKGYLRPYQWEDLTVEVYI